MFFALFLQLRFHERFLSQDMNGSFESATLLFVHSDTVARIQHLAVLNVTADVIVFVKYMMIAAMIMLGVWVHLRIKLICRVMLSVASSWNLFTQNFITLLIGVQRSSKEATSTTIVDCGISVLKIL